MNQNDKKNLTNQEVLNKIDQIRELVFKDKETRDREILEYLLGQRDHVSWLGQDLLSFLADTREKAKKRNLIQAITLGGEIIGFGGIGLGIAGIAIAAGSIYVIPFIPVLMLYSPVFAAAGGGLLLLTIVSKMVRNISPDKDVAEFNKLKEDIEQKHPELKQEIKKSTKNKTSTKKSDIKLDSPQNNEPIKVVEGSGPGIPPPPPPPPPPPKPVKAPKKPTNLKEVTSKAEIKPGNAEVENKQPEQTNQSKVNDKPQQKTEEEPKDFKAKMAFLQEKMGSRSKGTQPQKPSKVEVKQSDKISNVRKQLEDEMSKKSPQNEDSPQNNEPIKVVEGSRPGIPAPPPPPPPPPPPSKLPLQTLNNKKENQSKLQNAKEIIQKSKNSKGKSKDQKEQ